MPRAINSVIARIALFYVGSVFLLGLRLLTTGKVLTGSIMIAGALLYLGWRRGRFGRQGMPIDDARRLLGVSAEAGEEEIRAAHRRLIARVHPDAGGNAALAQRINVARDVLLRQIEKGPR